MVDTKPRKFRTRQCQDPACGLTFPVDDGSALGSSCPRCSKPTTFVSDPYATSAAPGADTPPALRLAALLDNIRSLRNVGSIFRTADGAGVEHLYLGGITPTPAHPKLAKTALGAERAIAWTHGPDAAAMASELVASGHRLWALEGGESTSMFASSPSPDTERPIVLVLGHEVSGVDPRILAQCERVLHIPMLGIKDSLNVSVAFGVASYWLRFGTPPVTTP